MIVYNQSDFDEAIDLGEEIELYDCTVSINRDNFYFRVKGDGIVHTYGSVIIRAYEDVNLIVHDSVKVTAFDSVRIIALGQNEIRLCMDSKAWTSSPYQITARKPENIRSLNDLFNNI